ncbi:unnamed protein product [Echinostoma caproni]|uniref:Phorbol-ester/DAG-type domain-containing protein n=1 Tax=Echinostoma caproni TaxID=27848 RepID=A0A183A1E0_9TREM|nr:unnamed protein product [Echinostoma caproni]
MQSFHWTCKLIAINCCAHCVLQSIVFQKPATLNRLNRPHNFTSRSILRMDMCSACGRRIAFGKTAYKCTVCRLLVHPSCKKGVTLVPAPPFSSSRPKGPVVAPTSPTLSVRLGIRNINLTDFCPEDQFPRIPALIIHCVTEVVARGMNTVGLYRVSGSEKQVRGEPSNKQSVSYTGWLLTAVDPIMPERSTG